MISEQTVGELVAMFADAIAPRLAEELAARLERPDRDVTSTEAARILGVSVGTIRRRARAGLIPFRVEGPRLLFSVRDLDAYRAQRALPTHLRKPRALSSARLAEKASDHFRDRLRSAS